MAEWRRHTGMLKLRSNLSKTSFLLAALVTALALLAGACSSDSANTPGITGGTGGGENGSGNGDGPEGSGSSDGTPEPTVVLDDLELLAALRNFNQCSELLDYLRTEAGKRVGPYGLDDDGGFGFPVPLRAEAMEESASADSAASAPAAQGGDGGFSSTNVQVAGVDEPDIVKTDGNRILAVAQGALHYVDVSGGQPAYRGKVDLGDGWGYEIFMRGDRALVFSGGDGGAVPFPIIEPEIGDSEMADIAPTGFYSPTALIQEIDLSNPAAMTVTATLRVEGSYLSARSVGDVVWVSLNSYPAQFEFVYPRGPAAEDAAEAANRAIVANSELDDWLPTYRFDGPSGTSSGVLTDCDQVYAPDQFSGFSTLSVLTLSLAGPLTSGDAASVLADGQTLYGSGASLYLANSTWEQPEIARDEIAIAPMPEDWYTEVHKFSVSAGAPARYEASGTVPGHLLNQFSMDEHNDHFRVATTIGEPWNSETSESQIAVLAQQGRRLVEVGNVGGLGKGERIYSVRFMGDRGYVVTFRQVDPLYVLDLSDPTAPSVTGELKIPGFSTYLHPIGDGLLLGVGQDADDTGRTRGTKVSLFDVSNPAAPAELDVIVFPDAYSEAEWDHRAFLSWPPENMVAIPLTRYDYEGDNDFFGAVALEITRDGITEIGRVSHREQQVVFEGCRPVDNDEVARAFGSESEIRICPLDAPDNYPAQECSDETKWAREDFPAIDIGDDEKLIICWIWTPPIQRLVVVGDTLWTMSEHALQANNLSTFAYEDQFELTSN